MLPTMFFPKRMPKKTAISPRILLARILINASLYSPERMSAIVSNAKDENVVKPPKKPVKRKARV